MDPAAAMHDAIIAHGAELSATTGGVVSMTSRSSRLSTTGVWALSAECSVLRRQRASSSVFFEDEEPG
jgi:hypothetical protein